MRSSESQLWYLEVNPGDKSLLLTSCLSLIADSPRSRLVKYPLMLRSIQKYVSTAMTREGGISGCFPGGWSGFREVPLHLWFSDLVAIDSISTRLRILPVGGCFVRCTRCSVPPPNYPLFSVTFTSALKDFNLSTCDLEITAVYFVGCYLRVKICCLATANERSLSCYVISLFFFGFSRVWRYEKNGVGSGIRNRKTLIFFFPMLCYRLQKIIQTGENSKKR